MINELLQLMKDFEERNNISIAVSLCSDGSGTVLEFWENNDLEHFENEDGLKDILNNSTYKKGDNGLCINPIEKI